MSDDLISRQATIENLCAMRCGCKPSECGLTFEEDGSEDCADVRWIKSLTSAQPERKKGKWKRAYLDHEAMGERPSILYCSVCNQCIAYPVNFCPNCGTDMRGEQDE